jgi:peroxiredoxin
VPELTRRGVVLVAVSPQKPDGSLTMAETNELTYSVLSDPGNRLAAQLGILTVPSESVREAQAAHGLDLSERNADGTPAVPMPTVVLVGGDGAISWIDVHPDFMTRSEPEAVLDAVAAHLP